MFFVLGGVRVELEGRPVALPGQVRRLLGILLAEHGEPVATSVLIDRLWSGDPPRTARKIVHIVASKLRHALEDDLAGPGASQYLETTEDGYLLHGAATDLTRYESLLDHAESMAAGAPRTALASLEEALTLWGRPWGAQADEPWLVSRVTAIEERHRRAEELFADLALDTGCAGHVVDRLRSALEREPFRERRWAQLMLALYQDGRQIDALGVYDEASALLMDEFGVQPGPELQRLRVAILEHDVTLQPPRSPLSDVSGVTSFVGRDRALERLAADLASHRLVTVLGIGGIGKTRLVDEYAHARRLAGDDVRRVGLASATDGRSVAIHIAAELGLATDVQDDHDVIALVAAVLGRDSVLLVLDAMEYAANASDLVLSLVERCPRLRVLATSRVSLGIQGERTLTLDPLPIGTGDDLGDGTALDLLIDRAGLDTATLTDEQLDLLLERAESTGGVPMLIELAAPSVVDADTTASVAGNGSDHREATRAAITHALSAVDERACELAIDAAVLPDGVSDRTAAALRGLPRDVARRSLRQLAWVNVMHTRSALDGIRYQSLDPVREALRPEPIAEREVALDRATRAVEAAFLAFAPDPSLPHVVSLLDAAEDEHANLRFLLAHQLGAKPVRALELAIAASEFWASRGFSIEGRRWIEEAIEAAQPTGPLSWDATLALVRATRTFPEIATLRGVIEDCVDDMRRADEDSIRLPGGLMYLAIARGWSGDRQGAIDALDEAEPLLERWGTEWTRVLFAQLRGLQLAAAGDLRGAREAQRAAAPRLIELGDPSSAAMAIYMASVLGDMAAEDDVLDDIHNARELATTVKDVTLLGLLLLVEARVLRRAGDERGRQLFAEAAQELADLGGIRSASLAQRDLGLLELALGDESTASDHLRAALPSLLQLDRPAAGVTAGALAVMRHRRGDERQTANLLSAALALREGQAPVWEDDWRQLTALATSIGMPLSELAPEALSDARLLEILDG